MIDESLQDAETRMKKAVESTRHDLASLRTGRASTGLVDKLHVEYYGTATPLNQLASVSTPESRQIMIQPWDRATLSAIEKAILKSDLGLTPNNDGTSIRLSIPPLTQERRRDLTKLVHRRVEEGRVAVRNIRRDALEDLKEFEKEKMISQDDLKRAQERLQKLTDRYVAEVDKAGEAKEAELMEV